MFVLDGGISKRRRRILPTYKEGRGKGIGLSEQEKDTFLEKFRQNRARLRTLLPMLGIRVLEMGGREADDVIAHIARDETLSGRCAIVVSEDKDMYQLVSDRIHVMRPIRKDYLTLESFEDISGYETPHKHLLSKAILGDAGDKIPGIKGTGTASAKEILKYADDLMSIELYCQAARSKRVSKVAESMDIVQRNLDLIDLSKEEFFDSEKSTIRKIIGTSIRADVAAAFESFKSMDMTSICTIFHGWVGPFMGLT